MTLLLIVKICVVIVFLAFFLRRPSLVWGTGLLTVTTAVLLDTVLGTFGREQMQAELGFFYPVVSGMLFAGAAIWLWGILRPVTAVAGSDSAPAAATPTAEPPRREPPANVDPAFDRPMIYEQIRERFSRNDVLDLMFDLEIGENEVMTLQQDMDQVIHNIIDAAEDREQTAALSLAVERILTPLPPSRLPRLEKISVASPPTILRQYLLAHYNLDQMAQMAAALGLDWEQIGTGSKKTRVRELLLYLSRRNRLDDLVTLMRERNDQ